MERKDLFSRQAEGYAAFRPTYPDELYKFIYSHVSHWGKAWDCGTGNGQVAQMLSLKFHEVYATDISSRQLGQARHASNITYSVCKAERTPFPALSFDLITVAQALHWFELDQFFEEVRRVARSGCILAVWGYALCMIDDPVDKDMQDFYSDTVGPYWDRARKHVENHYTSIALPYQEIQFPALFITRRWNLRELTGYVRTWSATQEYVREKKADPVDVLFSTLSEKWMAGEVKTVRFPVFGKLCRVVA